MIFASENLPEYEETGFYAHGEYPFILDPLFPVEGSPAGFGYIDVLKDCQSYIDRLNQALLKNALLAGKKRFFIRQDGAVSEQEFANWQNDFVHVAGNLSEDCIREITVQPLSGLYTTLLDEKINEMKETSGVPGLLAGRRDRRRDGGHGHRSLAGGGVKAQPGYDLRRVSGVYAFVRAVH